jgi:hypothetical protein
MGVNKIERPPPFMYLLAYFPKIFPEGQTVKLTREQVRDKYLKMAKSTGYDEAITAIHNELGNLEPHVFDGGFSKERFADLQHMRELARELYTLKLTEASKEYYK